MLITNAYSVLPLCVSAAIFAARRSRPVAAVATDWVAIDIEYRAVIAAVSLLAFTIADFVTNGIWMACDAVSEEWSIAC
jgi:hypothetical protein